MGFTLHTMKNFIKFVIFAYTILNSLYLLGQNGHPLFRNIPNYKIIWQERKVEEIIIPLSNEKKTVRGKKIFVSYKSNYNTSNYYAKHHEILNKFSVDMNRIGGKQIFAEGNFAVYRAEKYTKVLWLVVETYNEGKEYCIVVLEETNKSDDLYARLNLSGHVAIRINFDSNKIKIPPESMNLIEAIVEMMKANPKLQIRIEGHTDNVGNASLNKQLSQRRAQSVKFEIITKGISADRLASIGWGGKKPMANNNTKQGRFRNRRVELVKINLN